MSVLCQVAKLGRSISVVLNETTSQWRKVHNLNVLWDLLVLQCQQLSQLMNKNSVSVSASEHECLNLANYLWPWPWPWQRDMLNKPLHKGQWSLSDNNYGGHSSNVTVTVTDRLVLLVLSSTGTEAQLNLKLVKLREAQFRVWSVLCVFTDLFCSSYACIRRTAIAVLNLKGYTSLVSSFSKATMTNILNLFIEKITW